jgi:hypothetical protein
VLAMLAHAFLTITATDQPEPPSTSGLIAFTRNENRHLLSPPSQPRSHIYPATAGPGRPGDAATNSTRNSATTSGEKPAGQDSHTGSKGSHTDRKPLERGGARRYGRPHVLGGTGRDTSSGRRQRSIPPTLRAESCPFVSHAVDHRFRSGTSPFSIDIATGRSACDRELFQGEC